VANTSGLTEGVVRMTVQTVVGSNVLTPDAAGVPDLLDAVRHPELDELAGERAALALRLLGPAGPPPQERFAAAVRSLCAAAGEHRARRAERLATELPVPGPRRGPAQRPTASAGTPHAGRTEPRGRV
ncbi:hypothetical protein ACFTXB_20610, partial [Streptomyces sp. NPDC057074]